MVYLKDKKDREYKKSNEIIIKAKSVPCMDCNKVYPWYVMDFDHVRGEKKFNIGASRHCGINKIKEEIEKCEIVCSNCHRFRTYQYIIAS